MGAVGEVWADAGLHVDNASFAAYASKLKGAEEGVSGFSGAMTGGFAGALAAIPVITAGVAGMGLSYASSLQDISASYLTMFGSQEKVAEKMQWLKSFAATSPFEFPELAEQGMLLQNMGLDMERFLPLSAKVAAGMNKPVEQVTEALADLQNGEFERMKELGMKFVAVTKDNMGQYGATVDQVGQYALTAFDNNGKAITKIVDKNNREQILSTTEAIWNEKYGTALASRSATFSGQLSNIKDNLTMGLADLVGFDFETGVASAGSLFSVLQGGLGIVSGLTTAFATMSEPMQTLVVLGAVALSGIALLSAGMLAFSATGLTAAGVMAGLGVAINTAIWPATLIVGAIALLGFGLYELEKRTGLLSAAWEVLKDVFTIAVDYLSRAATSLKDWITVEVDAIRAKLLEIIPEGAITGITDFYNMVTGYFGGAAQKISNEADIIKVKNGEMEVSFGGSGEAAALFGGMASSGYGQVEAAATGAGSTVQTAGSQMITTYDVIGGAAGTMGANVAGAVAPVTSVNSAMTVGTGAANGYASAFKNVSGMSAEAANSAISAGAKIGAAIKTSYDQVGNLISLAGKWNTTAKLGTTSGGGNGSGEGGVKIKNNPNLYTANETAARTAANRTTTVHVGTVNNYGTANSQTKTKLSVLSGG